MEPRSLARLLLCLAALAPARAALAQGLAGVPDLPRAEAIRSPDGSFVLTIYPPTAWIGAEVEVKGGDGVDLGAATPDAPVQVRGFTSRAGPLDITLRIATPEKVGITWEFDLVPTPVPSKSPELRRGETKKKRGRR